MCCKEYEAADIFNRMDKTIWIYMQFKTSY